MEVWESINSIFSCDFQNFKLFLLIYTVTSNFCDLSVSHFTSKFWNLVESCKKKCRLISCIIILFYGCPYFVGCKIIWRLLALMFPIYFSDKWLCRFPKRIVFNLFFFYRRQKYLTEAKGTKNNQTLSILCIMYHM